MCPKKQHSALWHLGCSILAAAWLCLGRVSITPQHGHHIQLQALCAGGASHPIMGITSCHGHRTPSWALHPITGSGAPHRSSPPGLQWFGGISNVVLPASSTELPGVKPVPLPQHLPWKRYPWKWAGLQRLLCCR